MSYSAWYTILQYQPDERRAERINVGVVLACEALNFLRCATLSCSQYRDLANMFPRATDTPEELCNAVEAVAMQILRVSQAMDPGRWPTFRNQVAGISRGMDGITRLTGFQYIPSVDDPQAALQRPFEELVETT